VASFYIQDIAESKTLQHHRWSVNLLPYTEVKVYLL